MAGDEEMNRLKGRNTRSSTVLTVSRFNWEYGIYAMDEEGNYTGDEQVITDSNPEYHSGPVVRF